MANQKVPQLPVLSAVTGEDLFYVVDVSDITDDPTGSSKQITRDNILTNVNAIDFDVTATTASQVGSIKWDSGTGTLNVGVGDEGGTLIDLQVGQEELVRVYNEEATTLLRGEIVYVFGSQGNRPSVKRAIATGDGYSVTTLGMVTSNITSGSQGYVTTFGIISNLDTSSLTGGTALWLSPTVAGGYTETKPQAPDHTVLIGYVVRVDNTVGSVFINISNGWEIDELHDVRISGATDGDLLVRSSYSGTPVWVNTKTLNGDYKINGGLTATTISASTYQNLPTDIRVTGGTYSAGTATFTNNTGGTFSVTGFSNISASNYVVQGRLNADQSIPSSSDTTIQFIDDFDPQNWWNASTYRLTPTIAGYYLIDVGVWWSAFTTTTGQCNIQGRKNGNTFMILQTPQHTDSGNSVTGTKLIYMDGVTDYIEFTAYHDNGTNLNLQYGSVNGQGTWFSAFLLDVGISSLFSGGTINSATFFNNGLSANTFSITTTPTNTNTNTQVLSRNSTTGNVEYIDSGYLTSSNYSAGVISGATYTSTGTGQINLPNIKVALYNNANNIAPIVVYDVASGTTGSGSIPALVDGDTNYIVVEYNSGTPRYYVYDNDGPVNDSSVVLFMVVYRLGNFVHTLEFGNQGAGLANKLNDRFIMTDRFGWESGLMIALSGSTGVITLSAGVAWNASYRQTLDGLNSQDDVFFKNFHSGGTWTYTTTGNTLNNTYYDDGTNIVTATAGKYLTNYYYRGQEVNDHLYEVYSTNEYDSITEAETATNPELPELITSHAFLVGRIIVQVGETTGITQTAFATVFAPSGYAPSGGVHNDLTGLQGGIGGQYYHLTSDQYNNVPYKNTSNTFTQEQIFNGGVTISTPTNNDSPTQVITRNETTGQLESTSSQSPGLFNYGLANAIMTGTFLT